MFNIKYRGKYTSDEQLIKNEEIPAEAVEYGIVTDLRKEMGRGFLMMLPLIVLMIVLTVLKVRKTDYHLEMNIHVILAFAGAIVACQGLTLVHEVIHALFYPAESEKGIWKSKEQGAYFVYCEEPVNRNRFVALCLAPMFILGIIPFVIWLIIPNIIPMPYNIAVAILFWLMTIMAVGDVANVYYVLKEVPKGAKVFNRGLLRSFYLK